MRTFECFLKFYVFESKRNSNKNFIDFCDEKLVKLKRLNEVQEKTDIELVEIIFRAFNIDFTMESLL